MGGDEAIRELLLLDYGFFVRALSVRGLHPCVVEELHADHAIATDYAGLIAHVRGSTLDDARRVVEEVGGSLTEAEALIHAKAWVLTIVSIHGRRLDGA